MARQIAKCPGYTVQSGQLINVILEELAQNFDFDVLKTTDTSMTLNNGSGPYTLPADWLRGIDKDIFYTISGVPYPMVNVELVQYDNLVQTAGLNAYPSYYATNMATSPPTMYVWPPSSGAYPLTLRYFRQPTFDSNPELSQAYPWFPSTQYLLTRLAGELMRLTNDDRMAAYIGSENEEMDSPGSACWILRKYLRMKDDRGGKVHQVQLDRRLFGYNWSRLPNTKQIGW